MRILPFRVNAVDEYASPDAEGDVQAKWNNWVKAFTFSRR
jgi:hypothetical protein